jgi:two-component system, NtrC family, response regulator PilR
MPPLRDRLDDVPQLATAILARIAERTGGPPARLSAAATDALTSYRFPGNVRELENILERAVALADKDVLMADDLQLPGAESDVDLAEELGAGVMTTAPCGRDSTAGVPFALVDGVPSSLPSYLDALERDAICSALQRTRYNRTAASQLLGITFRQLRYRMQRLGIK